MYDKKTIIGKIFSVIVLSLLITSCEFNKKINIPGIKNLISNDQAESIISIKGKFNLDNSVVLNTTNVQILEDNKIITSFQNLSFTLTTRSNKADVYYVKGVNNQKFILEGTVSLSKKIIQNSEGLNHHANPRSAANQNVAIHEVKGNLYITRNKVKNYRLTFSFDNFYN